MGTVAFLRRETDWAALVSGSTNLLYIECASVVAEAGDFWGTGDADG